MKASLTLEPKLTLPAHRELEQRQSIISDGPMRSINTAAPLPLTSTSLRWELRCLQSFPTGHGLVSHPCLAFYPSLSSPFSSTDFPREHFLINGFNTGFLNLSTADILNWMIFCCRGCFVYCTTLSRNPRLPAARLPFSPPLSKVVTRKNVSRQCPLTPGR